MESEKFWKMGVIYDKMFLLFLGRFGQKNQNCLFKVKFGL